MPLDAPKRIGSFDPRETALMSRVIYSLSTPVDGRIADIDNRFD